MKKLWLKIKNSDFYKQYKEEIIAVPLLIVLFYIFNSIMIAIFPTSGFFDFYSQLENLVSNLVIMVVAVWTAHLAFRISFPKIYKYLKSNIYDFEKISEEKKVQYSIYLIITFIISSAIIFG